MSNSTYAEMSNAEIDRMVAERLFEAIPTAYIGPRRTFQGWKLSALETHYAAYEPLPFSTSHDAAHAAWMRLTEEQKDAALTLVTLSVRDKPYNIHRFSMLAVLDATPRQLCEWTLAALEEK